MEKVSLLIFGGSGIEYHEGRICAKGAFNDYLEGLTHQFDKVTWVTTDYDSHNFKLPLTTKIKVIAKKYSGILNFSSFACNIFLKQYKKHNHILIFTPFGIYLTPIIFLKKKLNFSYITYVGTNFRDHNVSKTGSLKNKLWRNLFKFVIKSSNHVIARGNFLRQLCVELNDQTSLTIPLSNRPPDKIKLLDPTKRFKLKHIIFIGIVKKSKGLQMLIEVLDSLEDSSLRLTVVGNGPDKDFMESVAQEAKFLKTEFLGWLDSKEKISSLLNHSSFLACPSLEPFEGVPRVIDESIMHKLPVIATNVGGIDMEFSTDEIYKIAPNKEDLFTAVREMLTIEKTYKKYVNGLQERYIWLKENPNAAAQHANIIKLTKH